MFVIKLKLRFKPGVDVKNRLIQALVNVSFYGLIFALLGGPGGIAWARNSAKVLALRGEVRAGRDLLQVGQEVDAGQLIETSATGAAKLELTQNHSILQLGGGAQLGLTALGEDSTTLELISGLVRAKVQPNGGKKQFFIKTKAAVMGVRGTDFLGISTSLLGESEIIVFEGKVNFGSVADTADQKLIEEGHWGGIGGRFGSKIAPVLALPANVLRHFNEVSTFR